MVPISKSAAIRFFFSENVAGLDFPWWRYSVLGNKILTKKCKSIPNGLKRESDDGEFSSFAGAGFDIFFKKLSHKWWTTLNLVKIGPHISPRDIRSNTAHFRYLNDRDREAIQLLISNPGTEVYILTKSWFFPQPSRSCFTFSHINSAVCALE